MKESQLTKQDIRDLLEEHTQRTIKPLINDAVYKAIEKSEKKLVILIEKSSQRTTEDVVKVVHDFMEQVDNRFLVAERDIKHLKVDFVVAKRTLEALVV